MYLSEFMKLTNTSIKTAHWLYDHVFKNNRKTQNSKRVFTNANVQWVLLRQPKTFRKIFGAKLKLIKICKCTGYYISNDGRAWLYKRGFLEEIRPYITNGYKYISITLNTGKRKHYKIARLVGFAFVSNPKNKPVINHLDGNKQNDNDWNLEWATVSENTKHAFDTGLAHNDIGAYDSQSISVAMFSNNGVIKALFGSITEASHVLNISKSTIARQIKKNKKHGKNGYYFTHG